MQKHIYDNIVTLSVNFTMSLARWCSHLIQRKNIDYKFLNKISPWKYKITIIIIITFIIIIIIIIYYYYYLLPD